MQQTESSKQLLVPKDQKLPEVFTAALLKVASRCNLDCDYCYVYKHADQSWREKPHFMSDSTIEQFGQRLCEYLESHDLPEFSITFHGGEPLLFGAERLVATTRIIRDIVGPKRILEFSLQSNGVLLTDEVIGQLESASIGVSLSLDGPKEVNDRHRLDHGKHSTFEDTFAAIRRLKERKSRIFSGVIAVIDPAIPPRTLFDFFAPLELPRLDLLLPDATYERLPAGRETSPTLYIDWINEALRLWFSEFSSLPLRWFDALLASRLGIPSPTDAMGLGAVSLIVIDTDGSYTDHDVFKITAPNGGALSRHLSDTSFDEVSRHPMIREHGFRLTLPGLASECRSCPVVEACGGGSVMHRWHPDRKLDAPSVYCGEIFGALETTTQLLRESLSTHQQVSGPELTPFTSGSPFTLECRRWRSAAESRATTAAERMGVVRNGESAAAIILCEGREVSQNGESRILDAGRWLNSITLQSNDKRLVTPFLDTIRVLAPDSKKVQHGIQMLAEAKNLLGRLQPALPDAFEALISDVIFVESTIESTDHIFSFSDDTAPNVLYIAPSTGETLLGADDLGDSLLHEFLHQVLYQMERDEPMLIDKVYPRFPAPWRDGLRPSGGFFHGTFVFAGLSQYWAALAKTGGINVDFDKATDNAKRFAEQAAYGINSLRQFALLTPRGNALLNQLAATLDLKELRSPAPGLAAACYNGPHETEALSEKAVNRGEPASEISSPC